MEGPSPDGPRQFMVHRLANNRGKAEAVRQGMLLALTRDRPRAEMLAKRDLGLAGSPA